MFGSFLCRRRTNNRNQNPVLCQRLPRAILGIASLRVEHPKRLVSRMLSTREFICWSQLATWFHLSVVRDANIDTTDRVIPKSRLNPA
jgi:hypothetical protein